MPSLLRIVRTWERVRPRLVRTGKADDCAGQSDSARVYYQRFLSSTSIDLII
jgi:hypothetical protein